MQGLAASRTANRLHGFGLAVFTYFTLAAYVSILARWPAQLGGAGDPDRVAEEFLSRGTAAAPPWFVLVILGLASVLVRRRGRWSQAGSVVFVILGIVFVLGGAGELLAPDPTTTPRSVLVVAGVLSAVSGIVLVALGGVHLTHVGRSTSRRMARASR